MMPARFGQFGLPSLASSGSGSEGMPSGEFHLHPHYRTPLPLDSLLLKTGVEFDDFPLEKYAEQIAGILAEWSASLLRSPQDSSALEKFLSPNFSGSRPTPSASRVLRSGSPIEIRRNTFANNLSLGRAEFLTQLRSSMSRFSKLTTAGFQVTSVEESQAKSSSANLQLRTRVLYELVGTVRDAKRKQCIGTWDLDWERFPSGEFLIRAWQVLEETQSRSNHRAFIDITASALGANASYSKQLSHGTDYWRTVLDGACGIDIYGHNGVSVGDIDGDGFDDLYVCQPAGLAQPALPQPGRRNV